VTGWDGTPRSRAERFIAFCDGLEEAGQADYARRGRLIADDLLRALTMLDSERSARQALQRRCEGQQAILARHIWQAREGWSSA
jgi:hypothetical protein